MGPQPTTSQGADSANELAEMLATIRTESGKNLLELVEASPVLLVFLRHFGCSFAGRQSAMWRIFAQSWISAEYDPCLCISGRRSVRSLSSITTGSAMWSG